jgi:hypothetical protein
MHSLFALLPAEALAGIAQRIGRFAAHQQRNDLKSYGPRPLDYGPNSRTKYASCAVMMMNTLASAYASLPGVLEAAVGDSRVRVEAV